MSTSPEFAVTQADRFCFLHVDLNSFFASVEQQLHPEYRNRPLAVVPTFADTTVAIAASYEAKALGIKTGTRVGDMKQICPDIILVAGNHSTYAEYSHRIAAAVERCCPVAHIPSIDEVVCQLIGSEQEPPRARQIALAIKQAIRDDVGETLRCSIGMAPNRYLAKIASDMQKPDGLIGLLPSQLPRALAGLELRDLPGVGARTEQMLIRKGITTMPHLLDLDRKGMHNLWNSVWGDRLYHWLRGHDTGDDGAPVPSEMQKSLGHSHVLAPQHRSPEGAWAVAHKLLHKATMRLRMEKMCAGSLSLTIRYQLTREQAEDGEPPHPSSSRDLGESSPHGNQTLSFRNAASLSSRSGQPLSSRSAAKGSAFDPAQDYERIGKAAHRPQNQSAEGAPYFSLGQRPRSDSDSRDIGLKARSKNSVKKDNMSTPQPPRRKIKRHTSGIRHQAWGMEARFPECQDTLSLLNTLQKLWSQQPTDASEDDTSGDDPTGKRHARPFFVGVTLGRLIGEEQQQPTLFGDPDNRGELSRTLDKLNLKYGHTTLHFAGMLPARDSAPTRIAFTQIPVQYGVDYM